MVPTHTNTHAIKQRSNDGRRSFCPLCPPVCCGELLRSVAAEGTVQGIEVQSYLDDDRPGTHTHILVFLNLSRTSVVLSQFRLSRRVLSEGLADSLPCASPCRLTTDPLLQFQTRWCCRFWRNV